MPGLTVDLWSCDVGAAVDSAEAFESLLVERTRQSWEEGADLVLWPEFSWLGLERFLTPEPSDLASEESGRAVLRELSRYFWELRWPILEKALSRPRKGVVLGTVPWRSPEGKLYNRAPVLVEGRGAFQDKLNLTPWEKSFHRGEALGLFTLGGVRFAVVICLDIEVPEIAVALRGQGVDLLLVPSATENVLGLERVGRCASARAVELGCYVGVSHLLGQGQSSLVDENLGRLAWLSPSQSPFLGEGPDAPREQFSEIMTGGFSRLRGQVDAAALAKMRRRRRETNPCLLEPTLPRLQVQPPQP